VNEGPIEALRGMGASEETIQQARAMLKLDEGPPRMPVLPQCWFAVRVFQMMANQWHWAPSGRRSMRTGLRFEALPVVMAALRDEPHRVPLATLLPQLDVMQTAALKLMAQDA
jgi:hypothetical protein